MLNDSILTRQEAEKIYQEQAPQLKKILQELEIFLLQIFKIKKISLANLTWRVKAFDSFWEKISRKQYHDDPFAKIQDLAGLRIVYHFISDYEKIVRILKNEFNIIEEVNKQESLGLNQFGYRSNHFIVQAPQKLGGFKVEIQVRTLLMHAWAEIEHKLAYKSKAQIPDTLRRKFSQMAALLEVVDERFDEIRHDRDEFFDNLETYIRANGNFNTELDLNLDTFQALLDFYLPGRIRRLKDTRALLTEISNRPIELAPLTMENLVNFFKQGEKRALKMEQELSNKKWSQTDFFRAVLDLTCDSFWQERKYKILPMGYLPACEKIRK